MTHAGQAVWPARRNHDPVNTELVWIADRDFHKTVAGRTENAPSRAFESKESGLAHARAHVRALQGKSTAFELTCEQSVFSCHVRPLYGEQESIIGSFGVAIETTNARPTRDPRPVHVQRSGNRSVASCDGTPGRVARRMRAFSRPGRPAPFDVVEHMRGLLPRVEGLVPDSVSVVCDLPEEPALATFDAARLTQIVVGIVGNARDAMPNGGTLHVDVKRGERTMEIVVSDDGIGMAHEQVSRAFEPYFTTKPGHAGLGLATARVLLAAGGGTIQLESALGAGTTVAITLPAAEVTTT
jgi:signal transduction histidine kinase